MWFGRVFLKDGFALNDVDRCVWCSMNLSCGIRLITSRMAPNVELSINGMATPAAF